MFEIQELIKMFCDDPSESRPYLRQPFTIKGKTYFTDGRSIIWFENEVWNYPLEHAPNIDKILEGLNFTYKTGWLPIPDELPEDETNVCPECNGNGWRYCGECGSEIDCQECDNGQITIMKTIEIGLGVFATKQLKKFKIFNNVLIHPFADYRIVPIKFDGGYGAIMPCRKE